MPRGFTRRLPALLLAATAVASLPATGCADEAAAATVGDVSISRSDIMAEADTLTGNEPLLQAVYGIGLDATTGEATADKSYGQQFVGYLLTQRIANLLIEQALDERDAALTDEDLEDAEDRLPSALEGANLSEDDLTDDLREQLIRSLALGRLVESEFGSDEDAQREIQAALAEQAAKTDVEVSSKFGSWDKAQVQIVPPAGPVQPGGETDDSVPQP